MSNTYIFAAIGIIAAVTALLRFLPFLIFRGKKTPKVVVYLGKTLPFAMMGMLVVYCLRNLNFSAPAAYLPALIASALTAGSFIWKRNTFLSVGIGTVAYMLLVQFVFV